MATRNLSVMFTDIKGFTERTSDETRQGVAALLEEHQRLLIPVFDYFDGTVAKTIGDAFLVYFDSPTDAVLCGVTIQEVLRRHNQTKEEKNRLEIRVAINVGEVELKENDVHGEAVNIAARLEGVTEAGEVYFTDAVYQTMNRKEAPSAEVGERIFKGIPHPIRVYRVIQDPKSSLSQTLANGIELTDEGPRLRGIRDRINGKQKGFPPAIKWIVAATIVVGAFSMLLLPSASQRAEASTREFMTGGDYFSALETAVEGLAADPTNEVLKGLAVESAQAQAEFLESTQGAQVALEWLSEEMASKPYLEPTRPVMLRLETRAAVDEVLGTPAMSNQYYPEPLESLIARHSESPEVPYAAAGMLAGQWHPMTVLWLYRLALDRGGFPGDEQIFEYCVTSLTTGEINYRKFDSAEEILLEYFPVRLREWALGNLGSHSVRVFNRACSLLNEVDDPVKEDLYYLALSALVAAPEADMAALYEIFSSVEDPVRREQILALHEEFSESSDFTPYLRKRSQAAEMAAKLEELWGVEG